MSVVATTWCGQSIERVEDAALLTGRGRFIDDLGEKPGTLHAAILRSPHAHARITHINADAARGAPGVVAVVTGSEVTELSASLAVGVRSPIECWPIAVGRVRYVGEPVAVVVAADRYLAEDALDLIEVDYEPLPAVVDPLAALDPAQPALHEGLRGNLASERTFRYGDPERMLAEAAHRVAVTVHYPRNSCTPIETYGVVAEYDPAEDAYDVLANFMGPFSLHSVMARALKVPGHRFRLRTPPDSGGSFGIKQGVFPYIVLISIAARVSGRPVKWIEDRLEHLAASVSATNRVVTLEAAVAADGRVQALAWDQLEDVGAHIRAPEPATLYRMHGNLTGAYAIRHVLVRNRVVLTNKTPTGLNRGFGGPQVYYALERLMQRIAVELKIDPVEIIRRNLVPSDAFPYRTATGGLLDSGDYLTALETALADGGFAELRERQRQGARRGAHLRHRLRRRRRAERFQYGLHHHGADAAGAAESRSEERRAGDGDGGARPARRGVGPRRLGAAGPGPPHRRCADRGRRARLEARRHSRHGRARHRARCLVDRLRQLFQPVRGGDRRRGAPCRAQGQGQARQARGGAAQCRRRCRRIRQRPYPGPRQSRQRRFVRAARGDEPLVAGPGAGRKSGAARDGILDAARADPADRGGRDQFVALPRLHFRFLRGRDRSRHRRRAHRQIRHHARLRTHSASRHGRGSDHRRLRARASARRSTRNTPTGPTAAFLPARSPIIWCRRRWKCRPR